MNKIKNMLPAISLTFGLIVLDRVTKLLADSFLAGKGSIHLIGNFFILLYAQNRGAFLSMGDEMSQPLWVLFFLIIPILAVVIFSVFVFKTKQNSSYYRFIWTLLTSGAVGNLIDRFFYGKVTDFMNMGFGTTLRTGIFNLADVYIVILVFFIVINELKNKKKLSDKR
ncbi:MAG TPA: signal peptidase II [Spirochaetia bacterium]|nr:MAG: signal peptidase II [Spirochaetes bacterium GWB1_36_13]HCL57761.1 signal peptidase II [Spirochaetia bacterium]